MTPFASRIYEILDGGRLPGNIRCIVEGLSGGPDSVALLSVLSEIQKEHDDFPSVFAVHVNHGLRDEAFHDEELCVKLCERMDIPVKVFRFDVKAEAEKLGRGLEETGRILRYRAFSAVEEEISENDGYAEGEVIIATAHHMGDLTETFLMNLFRGCGLEGLTVMNSSDFLRPFLDVRKDEILSYLEENDIPFAVDETNSHNDFTRNKWRNIIIPAISEASVKDPQTAVSDTCRLLSADADYIGIKAYRSYRECREDIGDTFLLNAGKALSLHPAILSRVVRHLWNDTFGNRTDFEQTHVTAVIGLMRSVRGTGYLSLPFGRGAICCAGYLGFYNGDFSKIKTACGISTLNGVPADPSFEKAVFMIDPDELKEGPKTLNLPDSPVSIEASIVENNDRIVYNSFSWFGVPQSVEIKACPCDGKLRKAGTSHDAALGKLMSDMKVPRDARGFVPSLSSDGRLLWVPGIGHSEGFISELSRRRWLEDESNGHTGRLLKVSLIIKGETVG